MNPIPKYRYWSYFLLVAGFSFICAATLSPFNFIIPQSLPSVVEGFRFGSYIKDYWQNILLFIPWGFGLAAVINFKQRRILIILIISLFGSAILSTTVELAQFFLPSRISNLTDIIFNTFGGGLGGWLYYYRLKIVDLLTGKINLLGRNIARAIGGYCIIVTLAILILLFSVNLSNWDDDYYLAFGNEVTGNRPWNGYINSVYICDRTLDFSEISTAFANTNIFGKSDNLVLRLNYKLLQLSNFVWMQSSENNSKPLIKDRVNNKITSKGIALNSQQWLITSVPATDIVNRLKQSNEFTISLTFATDNLDQTGPARIVSLSKDIYAQNLVIGQEKNDLHFRLRTPITGRNATHPELVIADVFRDRNMHQILITFANKKLNFYLDSPDNHYSFLFAPSNSFMVFIPWNQQGWQIDLKTDSSLEYRWLFYLIIVIPIVLLFGMLLQYKT